MAKWNKEEREAMTFDGVYHCAFCPRTFSIPAEYEQFLLHQQNCPNKPKHEGMAKDDLAKQIAQWISQGWPDDLTKSEKRSWMEQAIVEAKQLIADLKLFQEADDQSLPDPFQHSLSNGTSSPAFIEGMTYLVKCGWVKKAK